MNVRSYTSEDYESVAALYKNSETYGGQFDAARDTPERLRTLIEKKPNSILVAEDDTGVIGTVTLFEDARSAWLFRFAIQEGSNVDEMARELYERAADTLKAQGHTQVLVYAPSGNKNFEE